MGLNIYTVGEITRYLKEKIDWDPLLQNTAVRGEISNFVHHSSGHMYFTLKDSSSRLKCVMFKSKNFSLAFDLHNGLKIIALGRLAIFERDGQYQLYVEDVQPEGMGALHLAFLQLKEKLEQEGLFALENKKSIPRVPKGIGVITSPTGAALRDIITVIRRRFPGALILIIPALVQGTEAVPSLVEALRKAEDLKEKIEVLIIGRGGGSLEELWAFNEELLARAIYACSIPIVSAVGHETDFTIADFVADQRAPTPSAAAEIVAPESRELTKYLRQLENRLIQQVRRKLELHKWQLASLRQRPVLMKPEHLLDNRKQTVDFLRQKLLQCTKENLRGKKEKLNLLIEKLSDLNPLAVLQRGYVVCRKQKGKKLLKSVKGLKVGDKLTITMSNGEIDCLVEKIREG